MSSEHSLSEVVGEDATDPNEITYSDPSGAIFSMYTTRARKFDRENVENWKGGAQSILIFVRFRPPLTMAIAVYSQALIVPRLVFSLLRWHH